MSWIPDPPLASNRATALIAGAFPTVDARAVRYLGSGWLYDVFLTKDGWVFRFPRWDWSGALFEQEVRVHELAAQILPPRIRIPRVELLAPPSSQFARPFAGHRYVPGVGADALEQKLLSTLAPDIAEFLNALHSTPAPIAGAAGIHQLDANDPDRVAWLDHGIAIALGMRGRDPVLDQALDWLRTAPKTPPPLGGPLHLLHGGLEPEHVLADPATGSLVGVIDWTDAMLGDAARDFVFLVTWRGWQFAEDVLRLYPRAVDVEFRTRLRYMAQLLSLMSLAYAHEQGTALDKHLRAVHNAFAAYERPDRSDPRLPRVNG
jgi:aminoglycoside phosphotransferase (APT) family kinase protein